jgi:GT2 family glycosyltransferase
VTEDEHIACSVVLPALRDGPDVQRALAALNAQAFDGAYEVVIVSPEPIDLSACSRAVVVHDAGRGPSAAVNAGIAAARSYVIAFTDMSCAPHEGWLSAGLACLADNRIVAGRIAQEPGDPAAPSPVEEFEMRWSLRQDEDVQRGVASVSNLFVHRSVFQRVGLFREDMPSKADWEFCERARGAGITLMYCDSAVVRHRVIAGWGGLWRSKLRLARAMAQLHSIRGRGKVAARRDALRQLRPPLRSLAQVVSGHAPFRRKLALIATLAVSRLAYVTGWLITEVRSR